MDGLKESKQAVGAEVLASVQNFAPPTILAQASRLNFSTRLFNLIVTNVPGPQFPLYVRGRELLDVFPVAFLPKDHALAIAIMSYNGRMNFGLLGDYDALPDIDAIAEGIQASLAELLALARAAASAATERGCRPSALAALIARVGLLGRRLAVARVVDRDAVEAVAAAAAQRDPARRARGRVQALEAARRRSRATARSARCPTRARRRGAGSAAAQRTVISRLAVRAARRLTREEGARRSMLAARVRAAPASRIPQPRSSVHTPAGRRAVSLIRRTISATDRSGLRWRTSAPAAATIGVAIEVPCT